MLVDPPEPHGVVLVLPAATRYEIPGGVTETSTERRVIFSPEVPGPRVRDARPEWWVFGEIAARARPELAPAVRFRGTPQIRAEIARAVPVYDGIQHLSEFGDAFQYGGRHLGAGWRFPTPDGRARFSVVPLRGVEVPDGHFLVATRRGKQFNSMVHENRDMLTGAEREAVLINPTDALRLGLEDGERVVLRSATGELAGRVLVAPVARRSLQVHWPEGLVLIDPARRSAEAGIPDYNAVVTLGRADVS
jgi:anaerobic selenocysteine-containing dehydrogenase